MKEYKPQTNAEACRRWRTRHPERYQAAYEACARGLSGDLRREYTKRRAAELLALKQQAER